MEPVFFLLFAATQLFSAPLAQAQTKFPEKAEITGQSDPAHDPKFLVLADGRDLRRIIVEGTPLSVTNGTGYTFGSTQRTQYNKLKQESLVANNGPVQWAVVDLQNGKILAESSNPMRKLYGASLSKIFVGGTLLDKQNGSLSADQLQLMSEMIVVSSNEAWVDLQQQAGDGSTARGQEAVYQFTQRLGYKVTRGWTGFWGNLHGNELPARELAFYLYDLYQNAFGGASTLWKILFTARTGPNLGRKYFPSDMPVGGKCGYYAGPMTNPDTGMSTNPDGSPYTVDVQHHVVVFHHKDKPYGIVVLTNTGSAESVALLTGGLFREYIAHSL